MKSFQAYEAEMCNTEVLCPNCGTWLRFSWWRFYNSDEGRCSYCKSYHKDVNLLKSREVEH
jgi:hypothetical protein